MAKIQILITEEALTPLSITFVSIVIFLLGKGVQALNPISFHYKNSYHLCHEEDLMFQSMTNIHDENTSESIIANKRWVILGSYRTGGNCHQIEK